MSSVAVQPSNKQPAGKEIQLKVGDQVLDLSDAVGNRKIDLSHIEVEVTETDLVLKTREYIIRIKGILNFKTETDEHVFVRDLNGIGSQEDGEKFINKYTENLSDEDARKFLSITKEYASAIGSEKLLQACYTVEQKRNLLSEAKTAVASEVLRLVYPELKRHGLDISKNLDDLRTDSHLLAAAAKSILDKIARDELIKASIEKMCEAIEDLAHARLAEKKKTEKKAAEQDDLEMRIKKIANMSTDPVVNEAINKVVTNPNSILNGLISDETIMREVENTQQEIRAAQRSRRTRGTNYNPVSTAI